MEEHLLFIDGRFVKGREKKEQHLFLKTGESSKSLLMEALEFSFLVC